MLDFPSQFDLVDPSCPVNWSDPLTSGLVGWWGVIPNCGWSGSNLFRDLVRGGKNPNDGTLTNMAFPPTVTSGWQGPRGRPGWFGCLAFPGTAAGNQVVITGSLPSFSAIGVLARIKMPDSMPSLSSGESFICRTSNLSFNVMVSTSTRKVRLECSDGSTSVSLTSASALSLSTFYDLFLQFDGATFRIFINGSQDATSSASKGFNATPGTLHIGAAAGCAGAGAQTEWGGLISAIGLFSRALSASEVSALYQDSLAGHPRMLNWVQNRAYRVATTGNRRRRVLLGRVA